MDTTHASNTRVLQRLLVQLNAPLGAHTSSARSHWDGLPEDLTEIIENKAAAMRQEDEARERESNSWNRRMAEQNRRKRALPREHSETRGLDESEDFHDWMLESLRERQKADKKQTFDHLDDIDDEYDDETGLHDFTYRGPSHKQVRKTHKNAHKVSRADAEPRYQPEQQLSHAQQARAGRRSRTRT
jgi:hypothetical protein